MGLLDRLRASAEAKKRVAELRRRLKANPSSVVDVLALAEAMVEIGDRADAVKLLNELGPVLQKKSQSLAALSVYRKVMELDPECVEPGSLDARHELEMLEEIGGPRAAGVFEAAGTSTFSIHAARERVQEEKRQAIQPLLQQIPFFNEIPAHVLDQLVESTHMRTFDAGVTVLEEGAPGSSLLFVVSGELSVSGKGESGAEVPFGTLTPGDVAGEISFISSLPRSATLRTKVPTVLLELERRAADAIIRKNPKLRDSLDALYWKRMLNNTLVRSSLFGPLRKKVRNQIAHRAVPLALPAGETIDSGNGALYVIAQGIVSISVQEEGKDEDRAILSQPALFGIRAGARKRKRKATAITDVELFRIDQEHLATIFKSHPTIRTALDERERRRAPAEKHSG
jgi:CRP-like cAMP-binding protein